MYSRFTRSQAVASRAAGPAFDDLIDDVAQVLHSIQQQWFGGTARWEDLDEPARFWWHVRGQELVNLVRRLESRRSGGAVAPRRVAGGCGDGCADDAAAAIEQLEDWARTAADWLDISDSAVSETFELAMRGLDAGMCASASRASGRSAASAL